MLGARPGAQPHFCGPADPLHFFPAHCSIVTAGGPNTLSLIGGNVEDAVTMEHLHTNDEGELRDNRENWFAVLRVMYQQN